MKQRPRYTSVRRRLLKSPVARRLRQTPIGGLADTLVLRRRAASRSPDELSSLQDVASVCLFIGHVKSGGSLTGAMLDAHPKIVMGDEVDVARLLRAGISGDAMLAEFVRSARREASHGRVTARRLGGYSLEISGWSQGSSHRPRVIGASRPGPTTRYLADDPRALPAIGEAFGGRRLRFLHVIRRPENSIAAMVLRSGRDIVEAASDHARQCERLAKLRDQLGDAVHPIWYESVLEDCAGTLEGVLGFLGVDPSHEYLRACADLVDPSLPPESARVTWADAAIGIVNESVQRFDFLAPYRR